MNNVTFVKGSITINEKHYYIDWIRNGTIPEKKINFIEDKMIYYPDDRYVWISIFNNITKQLLEYLPDPNIYSVSQFFDVIENYYDDVEDKSVFIPRLIRKSYNKYNLKYFDDVLKQCPHHRQLLLNVFRKGLKKRYRELNFHILTFNDIRLISQYENYDILPYHDYCHMNMFEIEYILTHINYVYLDVMWLNVNNHYIEVNIFDKSVKPLTVRGYLEKLNNKCIKSDMKNIINIFATTDEKIASFEELKKIFNDMLLKRFQPACDLEDTVLKYCNTYVKQHGTNYITYYRTRCLVKRSFRYHPCHLALEVIKYSLINPWMKKKYLPVKM